MAQCIVVEGYDGAGKGTLIGGILQSLGSKARVIGRKNEPSLKQISDLIERPAFENSPIAECLLRFTLEEQRLRLVDGSSGVQYFIFDRGVLSAAAWPRYYHQSLEIFEPILQDLLSKTDNWSTLVCNADFETCWGRIQERGDFSRKEAAGRERNRLFYEEYCQTLESARTQGHRLIGIDTQSLSSEESVTIALNIIRECAP